jgi:hypothetical protein
MDKKEQTTCRIFSAARNNMIRLMVLGMLIALAALPSTRAFAGHLNGYTAPTGLNAAVAGDDVTLTWDAYPSGNFPSGCTQAQEIRIFRDDGGGFNQIISVNATDTTFTDQDLADGTYDYKIQARCNVPAVPGPGGSADPNNLSLFSNTANAVVSTLALCAGAPTVTVAATPTVLWPPNGKMVTVTVTGTVTPQSNCTAPVSIDYYIVDEYGLLNSGPANVALSNGSYNFQVSLEASRLGNDLDGRLYQIQIDTVGGDGGVGIADVNVIVPHDQRKK